MAGEGDSPQKPLYVRIAGVDGDMGISTLGGEASYFGENKVAFKTPLLQVEFADLEDDEIPLTDLFTVTPINGGSASIEGGELVLETGTDEAGGVVVESLADADYRATDEIEPYWTMEVLNDSLGNGVEVRGGVGLGVLDSATEDALGVRYMGNAEGNVDIEALYLNGHNGVGDISAPIDSWNVNRPIAGNERNQFQRVDGTRIELSAFKRQLYEAPYGYLGAIPGHLRAKAPGIPWTLMHVHEHAGVKRGRNFHRPDQKMRFLIRKTVAGDATNYRVAFASAALFRIGSNVEGGSILVTQGKRPSEVLDRTHYDNAAQGITEAAAVDLWTPSEAGRILQILSMTISGRNISLQNDATVEVTDPATGKLLCPELDLPAASNQTPVTRENYQLTFPEPIPAVDAVRVTVTNGAAVVTAQVAGYEEPE